MAPKKKKKLSEGPYVWCTETWWISFQRNFSSFLFPCSWEGVLWLVSYKGQKLKFRVVSADSLSLVRTRRRPLPSQFGPVRRWQLGPAVPSAHSAGLWWAASGGTGRGEAPACGSNPAGPHCNTQHMSSVFSIIIIITIGCHLSSFPLGTSQVKVKKMNLHFLSLVHFVFNLTASVPLQTTRKWSEFQPSREIILFFF